MVTLALAHRMKQPSGYFVELYKVPGLKWGRLQLSAPARCRDIRGPGPRRRPSSARSGHCCRSQAALLGSGGRAQRSARASPHDACGREHERTAGAGERQEDAQRQIRREVHERGHDEAVRDLFDAKRERNLQSDLRVRHLQNSSKGAPDVK